MKVVTLKGTTIERCRLTGVGKLMGRYLYVHKDYLSIVIKSMRTINSEVTNCFCYHLLFQKIRHPSFVFNCVRIDLKGDEVRFDEVPDFDTSREPKVGHWLRVSYDGFCKGYSDALFHHRWLWVQDDYAGFDVKAAMEWSRRYASLLTCPPKSSMKTWQAQLKLHELA